MNLVEAFGNIDIYIFDQILKGRFTPSMSILDAGCGGGRNLVYFLRNGYRVSAVDIDSDNVASVKRLAERIAPNPEIQFDNRAFRVEPVESLSFDARTFDIVISNAVLHFARDESHFHAMLEQMMRVLRPGGIFFARLASDIGIEADVAPIGNGRYRLPDGSTRFLVNQSMLMELADRYQCHNLDPIKTSNVQNLRCMTTWVTQLKA